MRWVGPLSGLGDRGSLCGQRPHAGSRNYLQQMVVQGARGTRGHTLYRDYFRLSGGLERRLYELGRKHCGKQAKWKIGMDLLHKKSGSRATLIKFRELLKRVVAANALPDYALSYDLAADEVLFYTRSVQRLAAGLIE